MARREATWTPAALSPSPPTPTATPCHVASFSCYGLWFMVYGMIYGLWFEIYGIYFLISGFWFVVYGLCLIVDARWLMVYG